MAAEVARLTAALEGPGSPIETMLAEAVPEVSVRKGATAGIYGAAGESRQRQIAATGQRNACRAHSRIAVERFARDTELTFLILAERCLEAKRGGAAAVYGGRCRD